MKLIVAVDKNWAIGLKGKLLVSIPSDLKRFKEITTGNIIVLGRKTIETFPGGMPLKNRTNIIMSSKPDYKAGDAIIAHSVEELLDIIKKYDTDSVYVVGGDSVYKQLLPYCDEALVTFVDKKYDADAYFPNLDKDDEWELVSESEVMECFDIDYTFRNYIRKK